MKHTPGPWHFDTSENYASKFRLYTEVDGANVVWVDPDQESIEQAEANARLIAAAPIMYKIIQAIRARINGEFDSEFLEDFICSPNIEDDVLLLTDRII